MNQPKRYSLPEPLLQAVVTVLNEQPARLVRGLLNAIEAECVQQDQAKGPAVQASGHRLHQRRSELPGQ